VVHLRSLDHRMHGIHRVEKGRMIRLHLFLQSFILVPFDFDLSQ